jgi:hypothetical protein
MAKKEQKNPDHYEYIRATIEDGQLRWRYRLNNANVEGSDTHDEDVSSWTDLGRVNERRTYGALQKVPSA